jgi:PAP2 superfamily
VWVLRREEWLVVALCAVSVGACFAADPAFSIGAVVKVIVEYVSVFALQYLLVFMATRFWRQASQRFPTLPAYRTSEALLEVDYEFARGGLLFFVALGVYTNLKVRIPMLNSLVIDPLLLASDRSFAGVIAALAQATHETPWLDALLTKVYLNDFLFLTGAVFILHVRTDAIGMRTLIVGSALLFLIGIWVTTLLPSYGPFAVRPDTWRWVRSHAMGAYQGSLLHGFAQAAGLIESAKPVVARAGAGVAALPSLHVAQLAYVVLVCRARPGLSWFAWLTVVGTLLTFTATVAYGWHYTADGLAGVLLAVGVFALVSRLVGR